MTRVALIHALAESVAPINDAMARAWPGCVRMNLLDDSLSADLARAGGTIDEAMTARFVMLGDYAASTGAEGVLFSCSAFGPCIDAVARRLHPLPVLKPNEAMIAEAAKAPGPIGLLATFGATLVSMPPEFPPGCEVRPRLVEGAMDALRRGEGGTHDRLIADAARSLAAEGCTVVALAQFSMARAAPLVSASVDCPVLTTVDSAVRALRARVGGGGP